MQAYNNLYPKIYSFENLKLAHKKAKKGKTSKKYVLGFEEDLENNLLKLQEELINETYEPSPLKTFIIHDPKLRKISKSEFKDRIVHHALVNVIEPIFDKIFICDSYANRKDKGTLNALLRLKYFIRKTSKNNHRKVYFLKADIKHYFETINREILINIIKKKIKDENVLLLTKKIINNVAIGGGRPEKGMPLGNLTSQFFANVYLNELDYFVKHELKIKYYIRYVDDFVILNDNKEILEFYKQEINNFLKNNLKIELHNEKSRIMQLKQGIDFLGFRHFYYYSILKKNKRRFLREKINLIIKEYKETNNYERLMQKLEAILAHVENCDSFNLRKKLIENLIN